MTGYPLSFLKVLPAAVLAGLLCGAAPVSAARVPTKVAILEFINAGDAAELKKSAAELLGSALLETGEYSVIAPDRTRIEQELLSPGTRIDQKTAAAIGKNLGAKLVAVGGVQRSDASYIVNIIFVDAETGELVSRKRFAAQSRQELAFLCRHVVRSLWIKEDTMEQAAATPPPKPALPAPKQPAPPARKRHGMGEAALGLLYPGVALKYWPGNKSALEVRAQAGADVVVLGPRYYRYFPGAGPARLFYAFEAGYISFRGALSRGTGFSAGLFAGGEIPLTKRTDLLVDFGPAYINLKDRGFSLYADGVEFVFNVGICLHFRVIRDIPYAKNNP